ncbi:MULTISPECIES: hypothetical protein [Paraburkholderia]|uniref:hypothetical protein n=1 Tax=Paraburkholderia TaxID=1822464 RepID=UPI001595744D|nr:hypothetical protein [Paraburkholderia youngii]
MNSLNALSRAASARIADRQDEAAPQFSGGIKTLAASGKSAKRGQKNGLFAMQMRADDR